VSNFSCAILAGGQSRRFGSDKTLAKINNKSFTQILAENLSEISDDVLIISKDSSKFDFEVKNCRFLNDEYEQQCPLVGIITGLKNSKYDTLFVISADSPFANKELIKNLSSFIDGYEVLLPVIKSKIYTLFSFYTKNSLKVLEEYLNNGIFRLLDVYKDLNVLYFDNLEFFYKYDKELYSFLNINTREDYERAKVIAKKGCLEI